MSALARIPARLMRVHPAVQHALARRAPIVALESTIITHGLPSPQNLNVANALEDAVRKAGATPATIALLDGRVHIGLTQAELERLAETGSSATKTSRRDVASVLAKGSVGATTVSGTMVLARMTGGIHTFGTGGIGGVHRGGQDSFDVSADLTELGRTPMAVFSSGAKSILDIPRTLEYLETMGVAVHTFEREGHFPAFYSAQSGCKVPRVKSEEDAARVIEASLAMGLQSGMLFGVPIPDQFEEAGSVIQAAVEQAVREHIDAGIDKLGKEATPWLLKRVNELTQGSSVVSNTGLVMNNVAVAARTAVKLHALQAQRLEQEEDANEETYSSAAIAKEDAADADRSSIYVFGLAAVDIISKPHDPPTTSKASKDTEVADTATTLPGFNVLHPGGVGRNMAEAAHRLMSQPNGLRAETSLVSPISKDALGIVLRESLNEIGLSDGWLYEEHHPLARTASVSLQVTHDGNLASGIADTENSNMPLAHTRGVMMDIKNLEKRCVIAIDGNLRKDTVAEIFRWRRPNDFVLFEPTSVNKAKKLVELLKEMYEAPQALKEYDDELDGIGEDDDDEVDYDKGRRAVHKLQLEAITPNALELSAMHDYARELGLPLLSDEDRKRGIEVDEELDDNFAMKAWDIGTLFHCAVIVKFGPVGAMVFSPIDEDTAEGRKQAMLIHSPAQPLQDGELISTTGAGDTLAGTVLACVRAIFDAEDAMGKDVSCRTSATEDFPWDDILDIGQDAARLTLQHSTAVSPRIAEMSKEVTDMAERFASGKPSKSRNRPSIPGALMDRKNFRIVYGRMTPYED